MTNIIRLPCPHSTKKHANVGHMRSLTTKRFVNSLSPLIIDTVWLPLCRFCVRWAILYWIPRFAKVNENKINIQVVPSFRCRPYTFIILTMRFLHSIIADQVLLITLHLIYLAEPKNESTSDYLYIANTNVIALASAVNAMRCWLLDLSVRLGSSIQFLHRLLKR